MSKKMDTILRQGGKSLGLVPSLLSTDESSFEDNQPIVLLPSRRGLSESDVSSTTPSSIVPTGVPSKLRNIIMIKVETNSFKQGLDIFTKMGSKCYFRFTQQGFSMTVASAIVPKKKNVKEDINAQQQLCAPEYIFAGVHLPRYKYRVSTANGVPVNKYETCVHVLGESGLFLRLKGMKSSYISFQVQVNDNCLTDSGIDIIIGSSGSKPVETTMVTMMNKYPHVDLLSYWYPDAKPSGKITSAELASVLADCKNNDANKLEFRYYTRTGNMMMSCWNSNMRSSVQTHFLDSTGSNTDFEQDEDVNSGYFLKSILLAQNEQWLERLSKLSPKGIIQVYLDPANPQYPMMFNLFHGTQGTGRFIIPNVG